MTNTGVSPPSPISSTTWKWIATILVGIAVILLVTSTMVISHRKHVVNQPLHDSMRQLWLTNIIWTRLYIVARSQQHQQGSAYAAVKRLVRNQEDMGALFAKHTTSRHIGDVITALLKDHVMIMTQVTDAVVTNDVRAMKREQHAWDHNIHALANALVSTGTMFGHRNDIYTMLRQYLDLTTKQIRVLVSLDSSFTNNHAGTTTTVTRRASSTFNNNTTTINRDDTSVQLFDNLMSVTMTLSDALSHALHAKHVAEK